MLAFLIVVGILIDIWFIESEYANKMLRATILKGLSSFMFVCLGIVCYRMVPTGYGMLILIGLILGMIGDILLNLRYLVPAGVSNKVFALGILAFLSGHFFYIAFLAAMSGNKFPIALILTAAFSVVSIPPLMKRITAPSKGLKIFGYVYLVVVISMFSFSIAQLISVGATKESLLFFIGAFLFVVSDFIMIYYSFGKKIAPLRAINLLSYYVGQLLIACSILFILS